MQLAVHQAPHRRDEQGLRDGPGRDEARSCPNGRGRPEADARATCCAARRSGTRRCGRATTPRSSARSTRSTSTGSCSRTERPDDLRADARTYRQQQKLRPVLRLHGRRHRPVRRSTASRGCSRSGGARAAAGRAAAVAGVVGPALRAVHPRLGPRREPAARRRRPRAIRSTPRATSPRRSTTRRWRSTNPAVYYGEGAGSMAYSNVAGHRRSTTSRPTRAAPRSPTRRTSTPASSSTPCSSGRCSAGRAGSSSRSSSPTSSRATRACTTSARRSSGSRRWRRSSTATPIPTRSPTATAITWMVNGLTTTDRYPYSDARRAGRQVRTSARRRRGTRAGSTTCRTRSRPPSTRYTGEVDFYKCKDEPVVDTWADIYPDLFSRPRRRCRTRLREQVQYPPQLIHIQFDDLYIYYAHDGPADVLQPGGPLRRRRRGHGADDRRAEGEPINFSIEPYYWMARRARARCRGPRRRAVRDVDDLHAGERAEPARDHHRLPGGPRLRAARRCSRCPKGEFHPGPEQADAAIDQDPFISQQIGLWSRRGLEVIRGHTTPLHRRRRDDLRRAAVRALGPEPGAAARARGRGVPRRRVHGRDARGRAARGARRPRASSRSGPGPELGGEPGSTTSGDRISAPAAEADRPAPLTRAAERPAEDGGGGPPPGAGPRG